MEGHRLRTRVCVGGETQVRRMCHPGGFLCLPPSSLRDYRDTVTAVYHGRVSSERGGTHVHTGAHAHTEARGHTRTGTHAHTHAHRCTRTHTGAHTQVHTHIHRLMDTHIQVHMHTHTYIGTGIHTQVHTHRHMCTCTHAGTDTHARAQPIIGKPPGNCSWQRPKTFQYLRLHW